MNDWLVAIRKEHNLTQKQVSEMAGISQAYYAQIEAEKRVPTVSKAKSIGGTLGFPWTRFYKEG